MAKKQAGSATDGTNGTEESTWLETSTPQHLLRIVNGLGGGSPRRHRLAAAGCCRLVWDGLSEPLRGFVEVAERYADREIHANDLRTAREHCYVLVSSLDMAEKLVRRGKGHGSPALAVLELLGREAKKALGGAVCCLLGILWGGVDWDLDDCPAEPRRSTLCHVLRDVFGNPFRPTPFPRSWQAGPVLAVAESIYAERAFAEMPVLADALEEAGCDDPRILEHCRQPGLHARGCWVVDLVLRRK